MAISIKTIAERLQVNPSTVSRALSGMPGVSAETRRRVREVADALGYVPDAHARDLRTQRRTSIAVICRAEPTAVTTARNYELLELGRAAVGRAHLIVKNPTESLGSAVRRGLSEKHAALVLNRPGGELEVSLIERAAAEGVALVTIDQPIPGVDGIVIDRQVGTRQAARLLLSSGRRLIRIFTAAPLDAPDPRLLGFADGFRERRLRLDESHLVHIVDSSMRHGYEIVKTLLAESRPDALFCYSDHMAVGGVRAAVEAGVSVGGDLAMIGFDDLPFSRYLPVSLTTVRQPIGECAATAVELATARIADPNRPVVTRRFPTQLVLRESAPKPPELPLEEIYL